MKASLKAVSIPYIALRLATNDWFSLLWILFTA